MQQKEGTNIAVKHYDMKLETDLKYKVQKQNQDKLIKYFFF